MSISPAKMILEVGNARSPAPAEPSAKASPPAAIQPVEPIARSSTPGPADASATQLSTEMQIDSQHQVYYETVNDRTGDVVMEIPPETLRNIRESLNQPVVGGSSGHRVDVKT